MLCRWYKRQNNLKITRCRKAQLTIINSLDDQNIYYFKRGRTIFYLSLKIKNPTVCFTLTPLIIQHKYKFILEYKIKGSSSANDFIIICSI